MKFKLQKINKPISAKDRAVILLLHKLVLPSDDLPDMSDKCTYWVAYDSERLMPCGYAGVKILQNADQGTAYLNIAGVAPWARGHGLQRRLITTRCRYAKRQGCTAVLTYTSRDNAPSFHNLQRTGFKLFVPENKWVGDQFLYWRKVL